MSTQFLTLNDAMSLGLQNTLSWRDANQAHILIAAQSRALGAATATNTDQGPIEPQPLDILCGKEKRCVDHTGSRHFRCLIERFSEQYAKALTKFDKTSVTRKIFEEISSTGARFLKFDDALGIWSEIPPMAARDKIGHALRFSLRRRKRPGHSFSGSGISHATKSPLAAQPLLPAAPIAPLNLNRAAEQTNSASLSAVKPSATLSTPSSLSILPTAPAVPSFSQNGAPNNTKSVEGCTSADRGTGSATTAIPLGITAPNKTSTQTQVMQPSMPTSSTAAPPASALAQQQTVILQLPPLGLLSPASQSSGQTPVVLQVLPVSYIPAAPSSQAAEQTLASGSGVVMVGQPQTALTPTVAPLDGSVACFKNQERSQTDILMKTKANADPAVAAPPILDDSLSLLDTILPVNQHSAEQGPTADDLSFDFDFDAEILSVLL